MTETAARCLVLACGNTTRSDDGVGSKLAEWATQRFQSDSHVRVLYSQQWTPDLAAEIATADSVLFVDSSIKSKPGRVSLTPVAMNFDKPTTNTHHLDAPALLGLTHELYGTLSSHAMLLTVGAGTIDFGETFSAPVTAALPRAQHVLEKAVLRFLGN